MIKVSVVGAKGRMGSHVVEAVNNAEDTQLALALDAGDDLTQITTDNTDVVVEFTVPSVSLNNVLTLIGQGLRRAATVIDAYDLAEKCSVHLSPVFGEIEPADLVEFMKENRMNGVSLRLQMHKQIWDPQTRGV